MTKHCGRASGSSIEIHSEEDQDIVGIPRPSFWAQHFWRSGSNGDTWASVEGIREESGSCCSPTTLRRPNHSPISVQTIQLRLSSPPIEVVFSGARNSLLSPPRIPSPRRRPFFLFWRCRLRMEMKRLEAEDSRIKYHRHGAAITFLPHSDTKLSSVAFFLQHG